MAFSKFWDLIVYHQPGEDSLYGLMSGLIESRHGRLRDCMHLLLEETAGKGYEGNLWHAFLIDYLVNDENRYSLACELRGEVRGSLRQLALRDFEIFRRLFDADLSTLARTLGVPEFEIVLDYESDRTESRVYDRRVRDRIASLVREVEGTASAEEMMAAVTRFYADYGVGSLGLHKAFRIQDRMGNQAENQIGQEAVLVPINSIADVRLTDLVGYELAKKKLVDNTEAFVSGRPANNCLLFGEAGTGKSTSIKAITNEYYERGLRVIEVYRHQYRDLNEVIAQLKNRNYRFILYMDDLSFEEFETEYKYLKAVIEGGLEKKPDNVLIYATSNRRHLIRENFSDRDGREIGDKHHGDTVQEKLSLSGRFGVTIYYGAPSFDQYHTIVRELANRCGVEISDEELRELATQWEMRNGGLSGRTAQQFVDYLRGMA